MGCRLVVFQPVHCGSSSILKVPFLGHPTFPKISIVFLRHGCVFSNISFLFLRQGCGFPNISFVFLLKIMVNKMKWFAWKLERVRKDQKKVFLAPTGLSVMVHVTGPCFSSAFPALSSFPDMIFVKKLHNRNIWLPRFTLKKGVIHDIVIFASKQHKYFRRLSSINHCNCSKVTCIRKVKKQILKNR